MKKKLLRGMLALAVLGSAGCGGSSGLGQSGSQSGSQSDSAALPSSPAIAAAKSTGPGATDAQSCDVPYGDAPAQLSTLTSGDGAGALGDLLSLTNQCSLVGGATLNWTDSQNEARAACLFTPAGASSSSPRPLVVFLQGSLFPAPPQLILNDWDSLYQTADLSGDASRPGFFLLLPIGRNTHHYYPYPDNYALGFDNWYRDLERDSSGLNVDAAAIDQFISQVQAGGGVDADRIYMTGWSNGGAMAELYSLNTPGIAATATYSATAPFSDWQDPCEQTPFATTLPPDMDVHNACDVIGTCQTSTAYHQTLAKEFPALQQNVVILNEARQQTQSCDASCASQTLEGDPVGLANHLVWPSGWDDQIFTWLRDHPLNSGQ